MHFQGDRVGNSARCVVRMSRGFGKLQRGLLASLERHSKLDTLSLAKLAYAGDQKTSSNDELTESQLVSVRRSLHLLAQAGLIFDLGRRKGDRRREWASERLGLTIVIRRLQRQIADCYDENQVQQKSVLLSRYLTRAKSLGIDVDAPAKNSMNAK